MRISDVLQTAKLALINTSDSAQLDAEVLLAHVLNKTRSYLYAYPEYVLTNLEHTAFQALLTKRRQGEPIAYLIGYKEFWSLPFLVDQSTLIPRPETEKLVETILALPLSPDEPIMVADLGTGAGSIALSLAYERPQWQIYGTDISLDALAIAKKNAQRFALDNVSFYHGNWCTALPKRKFNIIVSNPPYISEIEWQKYANGLVYEPLTALISGSDGLDAIKTICQEAKYYLQPFGYVFLEHGYQQGAKVSEVFTKEGYQDIITLQDLSGHARITSGRIYP